MNKLKKYDRQTRIYMAVTAVFLLACVCLALRMTVFAENKTPVHDPYSIKPQGEVDPGGQKDEVYMKITDKEGALALEDGLSNVLPLKNVTMHFNDDYTANVSGVMNKSDLSRFAESGDINLPPLIKVAIDLLNEEVTVNAVLSIELFKDTGRINASLRSLKISGIDIDTGFMSEESENAINEAVNSFAGEGGKIKSLEIQDGVMLLQIV